MQDDLVSVCLKTTFLKFVSVFEDFIEIPADVSGFSENEKVYRILDGAGNVAFFVQRVGNDAVHSFGAVIIDKNKLSLLAAA